MSHNREQWNRFTTLFCVLLAGSAALSARAGDVVASVFQGNDAVRAARVKFVPLRHTCRARPKAARTDDYGELSVALNADCIYRIELRQANRGTLSHMGYVRVGADASLTLLLAEDELPGSIFDAGQAVAGATIKVTPRWFDGHAILGRCGPHCELIEVESGGQAELQLVTESVRETSDGGGSFTLPSLSGGSYSLTLTTEDGRSLVREMNADEPSPRELSLQIESGGALRLRLSAAPGESIPEPVVITLGREGRDDVFKVRQGDDGMWSVAGLVLGSYTMRVEALGFSPIVRSDIRLESTDTYLDLELVAGGGLEVVVRDLKGVVKRIPLIVRDGAGRDWTQLALRGDGKPPTSETDVKGRWRGGDLPANDYEVVVMSGSISERCRLCQRKFGHELGRSRVTVVAGGEARVEIALDLVTVRGEVGQAGRYVRGRLNEVLEQAGWFTPNASGKIRVIHDMATRGEYGADAPSFSQIDLNEDGSAVSSELKQNDIVFVMP